ncbi:cystathionine gamma-lyase-like [Tubulanus polymorphus]|uniref:cystathionine gamma-lyase-like n=1 Tax=Tubulanus polymorphus TaxID=672921 RepID=UPI003DA691D2
MAEWLDQHVPFPHVGTDATHAGQAPEQWKSYAVVPPISLATTFKQGSPGEHYGFEYSRSGNPTRNCLEECIAALDGGTDGFTFSSGLGCTLTLIHLLKQGDHVICMDDVYGGTNRYLTKVASNFGVEVEMVDCAEAKNVANAMKPNTKMVWIETPTNPLLKLVDIEAVSKVVKEQCKSTDCLIVVDNTFLTSYFQRPLSLGADITMYSLTKYMNGHSDVVMGACVTSNKAVAERLRFLQNAIGSVPSPFDSYLVNRGLKTLHVRMKEHMKNGMEVAQALLKNPRVEKVIHPGLPSHPQHELAKRQTRGHSGMITFFLKGGLEESKKFLKSLKIFTLAESLGGYESLAELPSIMTHASVPPEQRAVLGISDNLIRLSVGIEDSDDLIADIEQALEKAVKV